MKKLMAVGIAVVAMSLSAAGALAATTGVQGGTSLAAADEVAQANQGGDQGTANQGGDQGQKGEDGQAGEHGDTTAPGAPTKK
jgi:hypothetical protein